MIKALVVGIIIISIFAIIFGASFTSLDILDGGGDYHTGFNKSDFNNFITQPLVAGCTTVGQEMGCWKGNALVQYPELIMNPNNMPIVTSMYAGQNDDSVPITLSANIEYLGIPFQYWTPDWGWYQVDVKYSVTDVWHTIINTLNDQVDDNVVAYVTGVTVKTHYFDYDGNPIIGFYAIKMLAPIVFALKGPMVAVMRVRQMTEFSALLGAIRETHETSVDYTFCVSGKGEINLIDEPNSGRYIAGVDTVKISATTGYSGYTQGGNVSSDRWTLTIYDNFGTPKKTWTIADDRHNTRYDKNSALLDFKIPIDAVSSDTDHTWYAILRNTLFDQDVKIWFVITKEELAKCPSMKPIKFSKSEYNMGDTVSITFEGIPNPLGKNDIDGFLIALRYGNFHSMDFVEDYDYKYVSSSGDTLTISFVSAKGDTYLSVEAYAFDYPKDIGGLMSGKEQAQVWIKDKEHAPITDNLLPIIVALAIFFIILAIAIVAPIPGGWIGKIAVIIFGAVIAYCAYYLLTDYIVTNGALFSITILNLKKIKKRKENNK